jgi:hypothetical protein
MTGNMQYGQGLDAAIAEGYFDSYQKNKATSQRLANQTRALDIQEKNATTQANYYQTLAYNQAKERSMMNKAISRSNALGWASAAIQPLTAVGKIAIDKWQPGTKTPKMPEIPALGTSDFTLADWRMEHVGENAGTYTPDVKAYSMTGETYDPFQFTTKDTTFDWYDSEFDWGDWLGGDTSGFAW